MHVDPQVWGWVFGPTGLVAMIWGGWLFRNRKSSGSGNNGDNNGPPSAPPHVHARTEQEIQDEIDNRRVQREFREGAIAFQAKLEVHMEHQNADIAEIKSKVDGISRESTETKTKLNAYIAEEKHRKRNQG